MCQIKVPCSPGPGECKSASRQHSRKRRLRRRRRAQVTRGEAARAGATRFDGAGYAAAAGWELLAMEWLSSPYSSPGFAGWRGSIAALLQKDEVNYIGQVKSPACRIIAAIFQRPGGSADCGVALSASSATIAAWGVRISRGRAKGRGVAEVRPLPAAISAKRSAAAPMR